MKKKMEIKMWLNQITLSQAKKKIDRNQEEPRRRETKGGEMIAILILYK